MEVGNKERFSKFPVPESVWHEYHIDQEVNDRGIMLDMDVVENAIAFDTRSKSALMIAMKNITKLDNPNSVVQMKQWLSDNGVETESLGKKDVAGLIKETEGDISKALKLRLQLAKSSVKKYQAMQNAVCKDGRAHGMFQFYGANRSRRWAGRLIQLQNLPQNHMSDLAEARELVRTGDYDTLDMLYDIDINYYFRLNFAGFEQIIDALGGVDVNSDYDFDSGNTTGYHFNKGENHLNGEQALVFARERYAFKEGDRQRGRNQMAVIQGVVDKATQPAFLKNYLSVLDSLDGAFETNVPYDVMASLVRKQLDERGSWQVLSYSVDGTGDTQKPYSMSSKAYVMIPDQNTVDKAKVLMKKVREGFRLSEADVAR